MPHPWGLEPKPGSREASPENRDLIFERQEKLNDAPLPYFPKKAEKLNFFKANKFKNEHSTLELLRDSPEMKPPEIREGEVNLEAALRRRRFAKMKIRERKEVLRQQMEDPLSYY